MKSQSLKLFAIAFVIGLATIFGTASSANAQQKLTFETEFEFQVGNDKFSAGKYEIQTLSYGKYVLKNVETKNSKLISSRINAGDDSTDVEKLVFNRYGETYFLRQIYTKRSAAGIEIAESGKEKEVRKNEEKLAENKSQPARVSVNLTK